MRCMRYALHCVPFLFNHMFCNIAVKRWVVCMHVCVSVSVCVFAIVYIMPFS